MNNNDPRMKNIEKAQKARRFIGLRKTIEKLRKYLSSDETRIETREQLYSLLESQETAENNETK